MFKQSVRTHAAIICLTLHTTTGRANSFISLISREIRDNISMAAWYECDHNDLKYFLNVVRNLK